MCTHIRYDTYMHLRRVHHTPDMVHTYMHACAQASHTIHTSDLYICIHQMRSTHACNIIRTVDAVHTCIHQMHYIHTYIHTYIHQMRYIHTYIRYDTYKLRHIHHTPNTIQSERYMHIYIHQMHAYIHVHIHQMQHMHLYTHA